MRNFRILFIAFLLAFQSNSQINKLNTVRNSLPVIHISSQSSVKNQGVKFTCTAFAIAAAFETFPGVPKDLSEKYLYAFQKGYQFNNKSITRGHKLEFYIPSLQKDGIIEEKYLPYELDYKKVQPMTETEFGKYLYEGEVGFFNLVLNYKDKAVVYLDQYEYLNSEKVRNVEYIKQQLRNGIKAIPVSYVLYAPAWKGFSTRKYNTITPNVGFKVKTITGNYVTYNQAKGLFGKDLNSKIVNNQVIMETTDLDSKYMGHAVVIVGYDNEGFIIKNSYGPSWRFGGYERISYDFHEILSTEALIIKSVKTKNKKWWR
ncbi:C1 family peptidase [Tenacibaculum sp. MEBiC06402]|uniref:C1 family peptidase n=1 Tax=unclassified Tenacibaculum TaxID=2635139 RepID=UPI003B9CF85C